MQKQCLQQMLNLIPTTQNMTLKDHGFIKTFALLISILWMQNALANQSLEDNASATKQTANQQIEQQLSIYKNSINKQNKYTKIAYEVTLPDTRLNLETCKSPLSIENRSPNRSIGRLTLKVACSNANKPWAVNISVNIMAYDEVVVSSRPISRNSKILPSMLITMEREVTSLHSGYFTNPQHITGAIAKYNIGGNRVLKPGNVLPPKLVTKGEKVVIKANTQGLSIRASGIALNDGTMGEVVKVKNSRTTRIIEGRVSAAGQVTVSM